MKQFKRLHRNKQIQKKFFKRCPIGGTCLNPLCMFGCVEY